MRQVSNTTTRTSSRQQMGEFAVVISVLHLECKLEGGVRDLLVEEILGFIIFIIGGITFSKPRGKDFF